MKTISTLLVSAILVGLFAPEAKAGGTENSITITSATPSAGEIAIEGESTLADGYTQGGIVLLVYPAGGNAGEGGQGEALPGPGNSFSGSVSVPTGQYDVRAVLEVVDGCGNIYYYYSDAVTNVTVPSK